MNRSSLSILGNILVTVLVLGTIYGCNGHTPVPQAINETLTPNNASLNEEATSTSIITPSVSVKKPSQPINVDNFAKLFVYKTIALPENVSKLLWFPKDDKLGLLYDDQVRLYAAPSFVPVGIETLPKRTSIFSWSNVKDAGDVFLINQDGMLVLWSLSKNKNIRSYQWPNIDLISAQISPSSSKIARSGVDVQNRKRIIEVIDLNGNIIQKLMEQENDTPILEFSPNEKFLAASTIARNTNQNQVLIWDMETGDLISSILNPTDYAAIVKFNYREDKLAVAIGNSLKLWNINEQNWTSDAWHYNIGDDYINRLTFALSDDLIIANTSKNKILFINTRNGNLLELPNNSTKIVDAVLNKDNLYLAVLGESGLVNIFTIKAN